MRSGNVLDNPFRSMLLFISLCTANKVKIASLGGIEAIIKAMSTHKDHSGIQQQACCALWDLALNEGSAFFVFSFFLFVSLVLPGCLYFCFHVFYYAFFLS